MPELHIVADPNGVGKTTAFPTIVPQGLNYVNADLIAKAIKEKAGGLNTQDIATLEAVKIFYEKVSLRTDRNHRSKRWFSGPLDCRLNDLFFEHVDRDKYDVVGIHYLNGYDELRNCIDIEFWLRMLKTIRFTERK